AQQDCADAKNTPWLALWRRRLRLRGITHLLCLCTIAHATASVRENIRVSVYRVRNPIFLDG
ncbi:MAG TPA: hypothetical protein VN865_05565, partial [Candidatus Acidoferrales bacterium]|nr:hypothetical protein [Candidatus Acidoferrales bacterium]